MIAVRCCWPVEIAGPSRSLPQQSPTTFSWGPYWSTCALSMRAIQHAHACFLKVCTEMLFEKLIASSRILHLVPTSGSVKHSEIIVYYYCPPDSYWSTFSRHEPPLTFGRKWWVQYCQTAAQSSFHGTAPCRKLLTIFTGNWKSHQYSQ